MARSQPLVQLAYMNPCLPGRVAECWVDIVMDVVMNLLMNLLMDVLMDVGVDKVKAIPGHIQL